ncbi:hypothetical protein [Bradyrhizobium sp. CB2312]|uniref:outer membrane protein n=1 Tax=Bradyrhizobium sp. CB2312 TaxID=3039155 RepID=UPI0024B27F65|nr:hypothetical protein [Bradyrhizobium sp. CB2312]WFU75540.1 hypothetical protein QA642_16805 [Bradyrhizobium sp. CB2312]
MTKFILAVASALLASQSSISVRVADMAVKAPPIPAPLYNWNGFYVGANAGGAWTNGSLSIPSNNLYGGATGFIAGVQAGYNFQAGHFLFGVEDDFDGATFGSFCASDAYPRHGAAQPNRSEMESEATIELCRRMTMFLLALGLGRQLPPRPCQSVHQDSTPAPIGRRSETA